MSLPRILRPLRCDRRSHRPAGRVAVGLSRATLAIDVWSDIACPWCWIGKRRLEAAIDAFEGEATLTWRAFELDPSASTEAPRRCPRRCCPKEVP